MIKKLGKAFGESIERYNLKPKKINLENGEQVYGSEKTPGSQLTISFLLVLTLGVLVLRLVQLTVIQGEKNREISDNNRIKLNTIKAPRGIIYDRNGIPLTRNTPLYLRIAKDGKEELMNRDEAIGLTASGKEGLLIMPAREYIYGSESAHLVGYLSEITKEELSDFKKVGNTDYKLADRVGRLGIEQTAENILRGIDGKELIETDARGVVIKKIGEREPVSGRDIKISVDLKLQKILAKHFPAGEKGAIVALNPQNGEVLGIYSSPSFDPNLFGQLYMNKADSQKSRADLIKILTNKDSPLFDRSIGGIYPSGSTFKIVTSAAGLESGKINKDTEIEDTGEIVIGPFRFPNWYFLQYGKKEGMVNIVKALQRSNDIFFYRVGEMAGLQKIVEMAKKFGLGSKTGIDLPQESAGLVPDEEWKRKVIGDNWYLGDTYHLSIGQGYLLTTPLQVALMTSVIASGGKLCKPHLISDLSRLGNLSDFCKNIGLKKETVDLIKEGMREACTNGGTGWPFFEFSLPVIPSEVPQSGTKSRDLPQRIAVACKTGTAEFGDPQNKTHAWFTVFAPLENPQIVLTVLVEGAGEGSNVAAPIAKKVLEEWLGKQ